MKNFNPSVLCEPNLLKPLHGLNPRTILGKEWWDVARKKAQKENDFHCVGCNVYKTEAKYHQWLEGHESYKIDFKNHSYTLESIIPLCHSCHNFIHSGRMQALLHKEEMSLEKFTDITNHGNKILKEWNLDKNDYLYDLVEGDVSLYFPEENGTWNKWHLIIDGEKYYSLFESFTDWKNYYKY